MEMYFVEDVVPTCTVKLEYLALVFVYSNLKFKVTCKITDFEYQRKTHIKFLHSPFSLFIKKYSNWMVMLWTLHGIYLHWWKHQIHFFSLSTTTFSWKMYNYWFRPTTPEFINKLLSMWIFQPVHIFKNNWTLVWVITKLSIDWSMYKLI